MLNPQAVHLKTGSHLGKYRILEELGEGPISHVFLADDTVLYRQVALKILKPEFAREPAGETPEEEMSSAAVLLHSGIVPLYGTGAGGGHHYFSMALMPGGNLRQAMERGISPQQALAVVGQVARALAFAHAKGINHQALKPENILFRKDGSAVLSDFHVVKVHGFGVGVLTQEPEPHPHYASPEQIQHSGKQFGRADLYSLGIVLYEMLTGQVPFQGENAPWQHIHSPVPKLPAPLAGYQELIDRTLAKKASDRFADVNQLIKAMDRLAAGKPAGKAASVTVLPVTGKGKKAPAAEKGDRLFIEGKMREEGKKKEAATRERAKKTPPPPDAPLPDFDIPLETLPSVPLDVPSPETGAAMDSKTAKPAAFFHQEVADPGSIGDFLPKTTAGDVPDRRKRPAPAPPRGQRLLAAALIAALSAGGLLWWKSREPDAPGSVAAPATSPPPSAAAAEEESARIWSAAEKDLKEQFSRAVAYSREGRRGEAASVFRRMTEEFPQLPEPYNNLAVLYAADRDLESSQRLLEEALRVHPSYATIVDNLNTVQLEKALGAAGAEPSAPRLQMLPEISRPFSDLAARDARQELQKALLSAQKSGVPPAPAPSPSSGGEAAPPSREAADFLARWADAWSARDVPRYLAFYGRDFRPGGGKSRSAWERERHGNVTAPAWIEVSLSELHVTLAGAGRLRVVAVQDYRSDRYRDRSLKAFELGREGTAWVILSEENLGRFR